MPILHPYGLNTFWKLPALALWVFALADKCKYVMLSTGSIYIIYGNYLAGLQGIIEYEASLIDGTHGFEKYIRWPSSSILL